MTDRRWCPDHDWFDTEESDGVCPECGRPGFAPDEADAEPPEAGA